MFFKQVYRNAAKNRKDNGLFFGSLVIAIIAFYTLLSLGEQDVMRFLATIESDAVRKLMMMLPVVYVVSLFFVFFLVYFACKYQINNRRKEFGMYLMLGMKRSRLFLMLFCETLWSSLISLLIGLPVALLLTEGISLATAKLVGLGIIGHRLSLSVPAIVWTICGFVIVQLFSVVVICVPLGRTEPADLLKSDAYEAQEGASKEKSSIFFVIGIILLFLAYGLGIFCLGRWLFTMPLLLLSGIIGTFFLYYGLGGFLGEWIRRKVPASKGLEIFTGRQVQENVFHQHKALTVSSLLLLMAISCLSYGISLGVGRGGDARTTDFSLFGNEEEMSAVLNKDDLRGMVKASYPMYLAGIHSAGEKAEVNSDELANILRNMSSGEDLAENMAENLHWDYIISESSYNDMRCAMGKESIHLSGDQAALYSSMGRGGEFYSLLDRAVENGVSIQIGGIEYELLPELYYDNIVADRAITLYTALIVPDVLYSELAENQEPYCYNLHLADEMVEEMGLMQAIQKADGILSATGLEYDSYLGGIGRNLFYTVAASYLTIYLGTLFLLIANTVIGLKYLIQQRQNKHRYRMLLMLGASMEELCFSTKKQIRMFFSLVLGIAAISGIAAVASMFLNLTRLPLGTSTGIVVLLAGMIFLVFIVTEIIYICVVTRTACREIRLLKTEERGSDS